MGRVNRLLNGIVSRESFTLSQSFYIGQVQGAAYECLVTHGRTIETVNVPPLYPVDANNTGEGPIDETTDAQLREAFIAGRDRYQAMLKLSARWAIRGLSLDDILSSLYVLFDSANIDPKNKDGIDLRARVEGIAKSAHKKYGESRASKDPAGVAGVHSPAGELFENGPPCLQTLHQLGFPSGSNKDALFNIGIYLKKRYPDDWETYMMTFNLHLKPPLSDDLVEATTKSLKKKDYNYTCAKAPICNHCNKILCRTRMFGIGQEEWSIAIDPSSVFKVLTDPPFWIIGINGHRINLTADDWSSQTLFAKKCMEHTDYYPGKLSSGRWRETVNSILETATPITPPPEASPSGELEYYLEQFCTVMAQAETREEILTGKPFTEDGYTHFRSADFKKYLEAQHFRALAGVKLYAALRKYGVDDKQLRIGEQNVRVWFVKEFKYATPEIKPRSFPQDERAM